MTHGGGCTLSQNVSSLALKVWERQCIEDWEEKDHSLNQLILHNPINQLATGDMSHLILYIQQKNSILACFLQAGKSAPLDFACQPSYIYYHPLFYQ